GGRDAAAPPPAGHERPELPTAFVAARDDTEHAISEIWAELLGVAPVGVDDDFFDLSGDSLLAAQVMGRVHSQLQVRLPLSAIFETSTVAGLAARVKKARAIQLVAASGAGGAAGGGEEEGTL
ncbi:MAG: hypothetical protein FJ399_06455, partial [Verrucomicrobia bacterium]|nr:hypothetical protein [Verrucomicrobiota bacterium]